MAKNNNGNQVVKTDPDPTRNVLDLVEASIKRIDDLREAETRRVDEKIEREKEHTKEIMDLRASFEEKLREAEAKRIDAIRVVDVNAVSVSSSKAADQALVLAKQVTESAEVLRKLVADTAIATATTLKQIVDPIINDIAELKKAQYTGAGKEGVTDPMMNKLIEKIDSLGTSRSEETGQSKGISSSWGVLLGAVGLISTIIGIFMIMSRFLP